MEEGASNSLRADSEIPNLQRWTRSLNGLPTFTYEMLAKHLSMENSGAGSQKHKKLGYQMFKDNGKGGRCKHIVALLFQIIEYKQLGMTEIPDQLTCTQLLQQWHVPIIAMCQLHMCNCCTQPPHLLDLNEHIRCMCYFSWQHLYIL